MEIERAHAKKERADSVKERVQSREIIYEILEKDKDSFILNDKSLKFKDN